MSGTRWLIAQRLRRPFTLLPLLLIVMAGSAGTLIALGAAYRTDTAYDRYTERANVGDLQINPSLPTAEIDHAIRTLPGVEQVTTHVLLNAIGGDGSSASLADIDTGDPAQLRGPPDGRYLTMDRPAVDKGRLPTGRREVLVDPEMAEKRSIRIGDRLSVRFADSGAQTLAGQQDPDATTPLAGTESLHVVGIATLPDEVLPDGLYPRQRLVTSADVAQRYDCTPKPLPADGSFEEIVRSIFPEGCSINYRYYSLKIAGGDDGATRALDAFVQRGTALTAQLPAALRDRGLGYELIPTITAKDRARVERATQPTVIALTVLGLAAGLLTLVVTALAIGRELRRSSTDQLHWWRLGMPAPPRVLVLATPIAVASVCGLVGALALSWWMSPLGPVGNVRVVDPHPERSLNTWVWLAAVILATVLLLGGVALSAVSARRAGRTRRVAHEGSVGRLIGGSSRPDVSEGLRATFGGASSAGLVVASGAIAVAVFLTAVTFGTSLSRLVSTPRSYGWPWDAALITNFGYGGLNVEAVDATMSRSADVERWTTLAFTNTVSVEGEPVVSMVGFGKGARPDFALAAGRLPARKGEVALGTRTARNHGVGVGDTVELSGRGIERTKATVTGLTVLPSVGPFESDRATPGDGMVVPSSMFAHGALNGFAAFIGLDLADGTEPKRAIDALRPHFTELGLNAYKIEITEPVRPAEIVDAAGVRAIPLLAGALLGLTLIVGLVLVVSASVRARRHELAMLRVVGFTARQLRRTVRVQTLATTLAALLVGVPIGLGLGGAAWRSFADQLAVVQSPSTPAVGVALIVVGAIVLPIVAASIPAAMASRSRAATILRSE